MRALIIAGGKADRLHPDSSVLPKPLIPIYPSLPMLELLLRQLIQHNIIDIAIDIPFNDQILRYFVNYYSKLFGLKIQIIEEKEPLGTVGAAKFLDLRDDEILLLLNADLLTDLSFYSIIEHHRARSNAVTVVLSKKTLRLPVGRYGLSEKNPDKIISHWMTTKVEVYNSIGANVLSGHALQVFKRGEKIHFPVMVQRLLFNASDIGAYHGSFSAYDMNTPDEILLARQAFSQNPDIFLKDSRFLNQLNIQKSVEHKAPQIRYSGILVQDDSGNYLFQKRLDGSSVMLSTFGGEVDTDESHLTAAVRELREETGIEATPNELKLIGKIKITDSNGLYAQCAFFF